MGIRPLREDPDFLLHLGPVLHHATKLVDFIFAHPGIAQCLLIASGAFAIGVSGKEQREKEDSPYGCVVHTYPSYF